MAKTGEEYIGSSEQRVFDVIAAACMIAPAAPVLAWAAYALHREFGDQGMLFKQQRIGKNGQPFDLFKLRTMPGQDHSGETELGGSDHPSASRLGRFIRRTGIDEAPQLWNVLHQDVHIIGIRSQTPTVLDQRQAAFPGLFDDWYHWAIRNPGVIGPGQNRAHIYNGSYSESDPIVKQMMVDDIEYHEQISLASDVSFFVSTPFKVVAGAIKTLHLKHQEGMTENQA